MKVHLVDGTYELFRAYYGGQPHRSAAGMEVGAVRTLVGSLLVLLRTADVTHVGVAFDTVIESFRNDLFDGYKTGEGIEPLLFGQFPLAETASRALGFVTWSMIEFEADDAIASAAALCEQDPRVDEILMCSPDKDLAQCVRGRRVVLFDRMRRAILDEARVVEKFGVPPASIPDYLALVGDTADGIPGVAGWGARSAAAVLSVYGRIENIPEDPRAWTVSVRGAARLARSLHEARGEVSLYKELATLRRDVPLGLRVDDLAFRGSDPEQLAALAETLEDPGLVERVAGLVSGILRPAD